MNFRNRWTHDHGADGLRSRFAVYKKADRTAHACHVYGGTDLLPTRARVGEDGEFVFVMRPHSDEAAWTALLRYAELVRARAPQLAADIEERLQAIYVEQQADDGCQGCFDARVNGASCEPEVGACCKYLGDGKWSA